MLWLWGQIDLIGHNRGRNFLAKTAWWSLPSQWFLFLTLLSSLCEHFRTHSFYCTRAPLSGCRECGVLSSALGSSSSSCMPLGTVDYLVWSLPLCKTASPSTQPSALGTAACSGRPVVRHPPLLARAALSLTCCCHPLVAQCLSRFSFAFLCLPITSWSLGKGSCGERLYKEIEWFIPSWNFPVTWVPFWESFFCKFRHRVWSLARMWLRGRNMVQVSVLNGPNVVFQATWGPRVGWWTWSLGNWRWTFLNLPLCSSRWNLQRLFGLELWEVCLEFPHLLKFSHTPFWASYNRISLFLFVIGFSWN